MSGFEHHRKSDRVIATFTGFEADLLRSLASQMVELLRNERAEPASPTADPFEALMVEFSGASSPPDDPVLARLFPTAYADDDEAASDFRRFTEGGLRDGKAAASGLVIDTLEDAGLPPELTEDGLVIDVELDPVRRPRRGCAPSPTSVSRWRPGSVSRPTTRTTGTRCPTRTRGRRRTTSTSGSATSRRRSSRPSPRERLVSPIPDFILELRERSGTTTRCGCRASPR